MTDAVHRALTGTSVHLASFTRGDRAAATTDLALESSMADIRKLVTLAHAARDAADVKVRQPLPSMQCVVPGDPTGAAALSGLLAAELNVKRVEFVTSTDSLVSLEAKANFRTLGKKFGKETPLVAAAVGGLSIALLQQLAAGQAVSVEVEGVDRLIDPEDVAIIRRASGAAVVQEDAGYGVALDATVTPELRAEGLAREVISRVQRMRKDAKLDVSDRIVVAVAGDSELNDAVAVHRDRIADEILAVGMFVGEAAGTPFGNTAEGNSWTAMQAMDVEGRTVNLALRKEGM
jgi:isoleucyl-tRNA synthetase